MNPSLPAMSGDPLFEEAREWMNRLLDGELSPAGAARLERLVCDREDIRQFYVLHNHLWCNLAPLFTATPVSAGRDELLDAEESMVLPAMHAAGTGAAFFDDEDDEREAIELPPLVWPEPELQNPWRRRLFAAGALAASVLLAVSLAVFWPRAEKPVATKSKPVRAAVTQPVETPTVESTTQPVPSPVVVPPQPVVTAQLARAVGAKWAGPHESLGVGQRLPTEPLTLEAGLAEVRFDNGVSMILEAPARVHVRSDMQVELARGKLVATVTERASGFAVDTTSARVVDLGTEFGVEVDPSGATQVEVFRGKVQAKPPVAPAPSASAAATTAPAGPPAAPAFATRELVAGEAGRVEPRAGAVAEVKPAPLAFVRDEEFTVRSESDAGSDYHRWLAHTYEVRRDPALAAYYTFHKPAGEKGLLLNRADRTLGQFDFALGYGGIPSSKPTWTKGRWPDKGALEFNAASRQGLFIPEFPFTTNRRITVAAWVNARTTAHWGAIVKNRGADDQEGQGQFSLGLYGDDGTLVARVTQEDGAEIRVREPKGSPIPTGRWVHVAMTTDGQSLRLFRDGREVGSVPCTGPTPTPTPRWLTIGYRANVSRRPAVTNRGELWDGLIDEVVVLHRALTTDEIERLYQEGRPDGN